MFYFINGLILLISYFEM